MMGDVGVPLVIALAYRHDGTVFALASLVRLHWTTFGDSIFALVPVSVPSSSTWELVQKRIELKFDVER
jgi:hypothetical protein